MEYARSMHRPSILRDFASQLKDLILLLLFIWINLFPHQNSYLGLTRIGTESDEIEIIAGLCLSS